MKGKIIGIAVFLILALSIGVAGVGAISQALNPYPEIKATQTAPAQPTVADAGQESAGDGQLYAAFTYVCPFH